MTRVAVFGAGAIGCFVGGQLQSVGCDVVFIGREQQGEEIREHGLELTDYRGDAQTIEASDIRWKTEPEAVAETDLILVCVKSAATGEAARQIAAHARKDTSVVSLQNGVDNDSVLRAEIKNCPVMGGMVAFNVVSPAPGRFHRSTAGRIIIENGPNVTELAELLGKAGLEAGTTDDIEGVKWGKLLLNINNGLNLISGVPLVEQLSDRDHRAVLAAAMTETFQVLKAAGIKPAAIGNVKPGQAVTVLRFPDWLFKIAAARMLAMDKTARSSMWDDLEKGRQSEVRYLNGAVVDLGKANGVETPVSSAIVDLVEQAFRDGAPPAMTGAELRTKIGV